MEAMDYIDVYLRQLNIISVLLRLLLAAVCGGVIGLERGRMKQAAGMRTHMLVCMGAAIVMLTGQYTFEYIGAGDPSRLGAQVISGIGFLGAGTILVSEKERVRGLTTAAGLWVSSCIGLSIGIGFYACGIAGTIMVPMVLTKAKKLEQCLITDEIHFHVYLETDSEIKMADITRNMEKMGLEIEEVSVIEKSDIQKVVLTIENPGFSSRKHILKQIEDMKGIRLAKYTTENMK